jgi:hypothetical protein
LGAQANFYRPSPTTTLSLVQMSFFYHSLPFFYHLDGERSSTLNRPISMQGLAYALIAITLAGCANTERAPVADNQSTL